MPSIDELLVAVGTYLGEGYARVKVKIAPGWDVEPVRALRERFPSATFQVDANSAYTIADADHLRQLDDFDLHLGSTTSAVTPSSAGD
jgi:O-succinylbenzoate synthase